MKAEPTVSTIRVVIVCLALVEAMVAAPLAWFLPYSSVALVIEVGILVALNASVLGTAAPRTWSLPLQASNLAIGAVSLRAALQSASYSWEAWAVTIGALYLCLFVLGYFRLSERMLKQCFAAQQLALASTLIFWLVVQHFDSRLEANRLLSPMSLRFLFMPPPALVAITFFAGFTSWRGWGIALAGVCAGQWGAGFMDLGAALEASPLMVAGLMLEIAFFGLLVVAVASRRKRRSEAAG